jgi:hypothetical protein
VQYVKNCRSSAESRDRRNTMWRRCSSVTFPKCGERLFASFSAHSYNHVRSNNAPGLEPSALRRQSRDGRTTGQRSAVPSGTTMYALSTVYARPTSTSRRPAPAQQKQQTRSLAAATSLSSSCAKSKNVYAGNTRRILDSAGMEILPGARLQSHGWHQRSSPIRAAHRGKAH